MAPAAARQSSVERPSHCSLSSQAVTRDKKPVLQSGCGMCDPPSCLIYEAFSSKSCQHPALSLASSSAALSTQQCAVILILEAISYPTLTHPILSALSLQRTTIADYALQGKLQAKPHQMPPRVFHCRSAGIRTQDSGLMKAFPPTHRTIVTFPCGLKNSRMDMRGAPTISRVLSKLRAVSLVWKY
jgi:hypothetical protein